MTTKLLQDIEKCLTCRLKDVRTDGIYCTCWRDMGWRCSYYAESLIKRAWSGRAGRIVCEVYKDLGAFYVVRVDGKPVCVSLWTGVEDEVDACGRIAKQIAAAWGVRMLSVEEADLISAMLDQCKCL